MSRFRTFFRQIHERSLWQVLGIYLVAGWAVLQAVDTLAGALNLPDWAPSFALFLLIVGLPIVLATAVVQEGIGGRRAADSTASPSHGGASSSDPGAPSADGEASPEDSVPTPGSGTTSSPIHDLLTWRKALTGGVLAFALWGVVAAFWMARVGGAVTDSGDRPLDRMSIAVLPFTNMGAPESSYFADGIQEDILTQLSKIGAFKVISRTSVMEFRQTTLNVRDIAERLGANMVLEGSVRHDPAGKRVRVVAQLIDATSDEHVWAEQYDRDLEDVFAIQSELALSIAEALHAELSPEVEQRVLAPSGTDPEAYDLILRGRELYGNNAQDNERAITLFEEAARIDPGSALAWTEVANAYGQRIQVGGYGEAWADSGLILARKAIELNPEEPRAWKALGLNLDQKGRFAESSQAYEKALELNPSYVPPMINLAVTLLWKGACDRALRYSRRALDVDPLYAFGRLHTGTSLECMGLDSLALAWYEAARQVAPDLLWPDVVEAQLYLRRGSMDEVRTRAEFLGREDPNDAWSLFLFAQAAMQDGDIEGARRLLETLLTTSPDWGFRATRILVRASLAQARRQMGDSVGSREMVDEAIGLARAALDGGAEDPEFKLALGIALGIAGDREAAVAALEEAIADGALLRSEEVQRDPLYAPLRDHPTVADLVARSDVRRSEMLANARREGPVGPPG